jgi:hypothetical protein
VTQREYFRWLIEARRVLAESVGAELGPIKVHVTYEWSGHGMEFVLPPAEEEDDGEPWPAEIVTTTADADPRLRTPHRRVLEVLGEQPATSRRVARLAGFSGGSQGYVRQVLAELIRWGYARSTPDGYVRAA